MQTSEFEYNKFTKEDQRMMLEIEISRAEANCFRAELALKVAEATDTNIENTQKQLTNQQKTVEALRDMLKDLPELSEEQQTKVAAALRQPQRQ